jgi:hypothetical protein
MVLFGGDDAAVCVANNRFEPRSSCAKVFTHKKPIAAATHVSDELFFRAISLLCL